MEQLHSLFNQFPRFLFPFRQSHPQFPLFRLPLVAYKNVIDLMTSYEQVSLSLCSRKTKSIVKKIRHRPTSLQLWILKDNQVKVTTGHFETTNSVREFSVVMGVGERKLNSCFIQTVFIGEHRIPVRVKSNENGIEYLRTYWEDENLGLRVIADYVCDLFRVDLFGLYLMNDHRRMFDWLCNRQSYVYDLRIGDKNRISDEDFKYVVQNSNSEFLVSDAILSETFRLNNFNKKAEIIALVNSHWITIDNLMTVDALRLDVLTGKKFTNKEVNTFLNHWIHGGSSRLKQMQIAVTDYNEQEFLEGINVQESTPKRRNYKGFYEFDFHVTNTVHLVREDGTIASFGISAMNLFFLAVWPDYTGRTFESFD
uniref:F-box domain-containing protein n=1 Tax=Caenorhabditis tropicalis TaxID=1561998 RepID=A0A1I7SZB0_9PELO